MTAPDVNADDLAPSEAIMRAQQACRDADKVAYEKGYAAGYRAACADLAGEVRELAEAIDEVQMVVGGRLQIEWPEVAEKLEAALAKLHPNHQEKP